MQNLYQVAFILSVIVMLTCILMISSSLNSNAAERTEFFGMLRYLGATKKQIMRFVRLEGLYRCKTAILIGIIFSIVIVWIISAAMCVISPEWFSSMPVLGISWISIIASILLGLLTVLLAARSPASTLMKSLRTLVFRGFLVFDAHFVIKCYLKVFYNNFIYFATGKKKLAVIASFSFLFFCKIIETLQKNQ